MKNRFFLLGLAIIMAVSCAKDQQEVIQMLTNDPVFHASIEGNADPETRVYADDSLRVLWNANDHVSIFNKTTYNREYAFQGKDGDNSGTFKKVPSEDFVTSNPLNYVYSVYPYNENTSISNDGELTVTLPAEQTYRENSFGLGANTMIAIAEEDELMFKNLCGYFAIKLYGDNVSVSSITLKGNNNELLAGKATVVAQMDAAPTIQFDAANATKEITLTFGIPVTLGSTAEVATQFWFVVPPTIFEKGFSITIKDSKNGVFEKSSSNILDIQRNTLKRTSALEVIPGPSNDPIQFEDPIAKYACVEKFDSNGDGEISYAEAAAVTSLAGLFTDWNTVTEFDEIRYFTGVTSTQNVFTGLKQLKHITIPDHITTIGTFRNCIALDTVKLPATLNSLPAYCFASCESLRSIELPTGITSIPEYGFQNCTSLETLEMPSTVTAIGQYAFSGCYALIRVDLPAGLKTIADRAFQDCSAIASIGFPASLTIIGAYVFLNCTALTSVDLPSGVSVGQSAFHGCSSLESVVLPENLTSIPTSCFQNCKKLASVSWPSALTTIGDNAFDGCLFKKNNFAVELPASVKTIGANVFGLLRHLVLPSTLAVSIKSNSFSSSDTFIYVPDNMVEMYKVRTNWNNYAEKIRPISAYPLSYTIGGTVGEAIDLGLSVKWASWNVGASAPEEYGASFAWGDTESSLWVYSWYFYKWWEDSNSTLTKYNSNDVYGTVVDNKTTLDPEDDAAHVNWGGNWRMPTDAEIQELLDNCTSVWTTENGVNGRRFTSNIEGYTDKSIFLPAAGNNTNDKGSSGCLWSSSLYTIPRSAYVLRFSSTQVNCTVSYRCYGQSIRPVCP